VYGRSLKRTLLRAALLMSVAFVVFRFILIPVRIEGDSMAPTYRDGGVNFINQLAYARHPPRRGDVVGVMMAGRRVMLFKRIVALPNERFSIARGRVFIDGQPLDEPYVRERSPWEITPRTLGPDEYLLIGDNRGMDQRLHVFGAAKADRIVGKVLW